MFATPLKGRSKKEKSMRKEKFAGFSSLEELVAAYERLLEEQKAWAGAEKTAREELFKAEKEGSEGEIAAKQAHEPDAKAENSALPALKSEALAGEGEKMSEKAPVQRGDKRHEIEEQVRAFFARYPSCAWLKDKMREEFALDPSLGAQPHCLEIALGRVAGKSYVAPEVLMSEEDFVRDFVMKNERVRARMIEDYLTGIAGNMPPAIIKAHGKMTAVAPTKPASVSEAGRLIERMLKERRI